MPKKCYTCSKPIDKSFGPSYREWVFLHQYRELAPAGVCCRCKKGFCKDHFGCRQEFDPEISTFGQGVWCISCIDKFDDTIEYEYNQKIKTAKEWENFIWPIGPLIAFCIRGNKPYYIGTRAKQ
jgi:hypothetical protein